MYITPTLHKEALVKLGTFETNQTFSDQNFLNKNYLPFYILSIVINLEE